MNILHVVAGVEEGGGIGQSVPRLCRALAERGHVVTLATLDSNVSEEAREAARAGVQLELMRPSWPHGLWFSWALLWRLPRLVSRSDWVHVHSNWTFPVWWTCALAHRYQKPYAMSPRGCLAPERLRQSAWKKRVAGLLFDRRCLASASFVHVTSEAEKREVEAYLKVGGLRPSLTIAVVPNGVDVDAWHDRPSRPVLDRQWPECRGKRVLLFLGRLDPIKGLDLLLDAWQLVAPAYAEWHLLIVGPDEGGYSRRLRRQIERASLGVRTTLAGPVYGEAKRILLNTADLFVLPTRNENFGNAVAEALACRLPVITTKKAPWPALESCGCGWWVDVGVEPLCVALREAMDDLSRREGDGKLTKESVDRVLGECRWPTIARRVELLYRQCENTTFSSAAEERVEVC